MISYRPSLIDLEGSRHLVEKDLGEDVSHLSGI